MKAVTYREVLNKYTRQIGCNFIAGKFRLSSIPFKVIEFTWGLEPTVELYNEKSGIWVYYGQHTISISIPSIMRALFFNKLGAFDANVDVCWTKALEDSDTGILYPCTEKNSITHHKLNDLVNEDLVKELFAPWNE